MSSSGTVCGPYTLETERAKYPYGDLWEASGPGGQVMVVRLKAGVATDEATVAEIAKISREVKSPQVVPWVDHGVDGERGWLAAPLMGTLSFTDLAEKEGKLKADEAARIAHQVARAVAAGDDAGVRHHTLSGEYVRLVPLDDGRHAAKVYGFGLAGIVAGYKPMKKTDPFLGVPEYMAPEQCQGKPAAEAADVYAIGVLMYEGIRGKAPFAPTMKSASASTTMKRQVFEKPLPLHMRYAKFAHIKPFEDVAMKALGKKAAQRYPNARGMLDALAGLILDEMDSSVLPLDAIPAAGAKRATKKKTQVIVGLADELRALAAQQAGAEPAAAEAPTAEAPVAEAPAAEAPAAEAPAAAVPAAAPVAEDTSKKKRSSTLFFAGLGLNVEQKAKEAKEAKLAQTGGEPVGAAPPAAAAEPAPAPEPAAAPAATAEPDPAAARQQGPDTLPLGSGAAMASHQAPASQQDQATVMNIDAVAPTQQAPVPAEVKPSGDEWFDDKPAAGDEPFESGNKSPVFWIMAGIAALLVAGAIYVVMSSSGSKGADPSIKMDNDTVTAPAAKVVPAAAGQAAQPSPAAVAAAPAAPTPSVAETPPPATAEAVPPDKPEAPAPPTSDTTAAANAAAVPASGGGDSLQEALDEAAAAKETAAKAARRAKALELYAKGRQAEAQRDLAAAERYYVKAGKADEAYEAAAEALAIVRKQRETEAAAAAAAKAKTAEAKAPKSDKKAEPRPKPPVSAEDQAAKALEKAATEANNKEAAARARKAEADRAKRAQAEAKAAAAAAAKAQAAADAAAKAKAAAEAAAKAKAAAAATAKPPTPKTTSPTAKADATKLLKLGMGAYKKGNYKLAAAYFGKARTLDPANQVAAKYLKAAKAKLGQ